MIARWMMVSALASLLCLAASPTSAQEHAAGIVADPCTKEKASENATVFARDFAQYDRCFDVQRAWAEAPLAAAEWVRAATARLILR